MNDPATSVVGVGVIGLGFMGATHVAAYRAAQRDGLPCRLVAVCDHKASRREGFFADVGGNLAGPADAKRAFDPREIRGCDNADALLNDPDVDLVSICTPTDSHMELSVRALRAGKHVLVEKPVALTAEEIRTVQRAARESGRLCMPAMCMRFWPGWDWLKDRIDDGALGRCIALTLTRLGSSPAWSNSFYVDLSRSGGALVDLHVHDADFVYHCFGLPKYVCSTGSLEHVTTIYGYDPDRVAHVVAEGGWLAPGTTFRMRYVAAFEHATVEYDLLRDPPLMLYRDGKIEPIEIPKSMGYDGEVRHLVRAVASGAGPESLRATLDDALAVAEMLDAERQSVLQREPVQL